MKKPNRLISTHNHHTPRINIPNLLCLSTIHIAEESLPISKYFIKYYKSIGVDKFYLSLNGNKSEEIYFKKFLDENKINYESILWEENFTCRRKSKYAEYLYKRILKKHKPADWIFTVDTDEIFSFQNYSSWKDYFINSGINEYDYIITFFADMIHSKDNPVLYFEDGSDLISLFRIPTLYTQNIGKRCIEKIPLSKLKVIRHKNHAYHSIYDYKKHKPYPKILPLAHYTLTQQAIELMTYKIAEKFSRKVKNQYDFAMNKNSFKNLIISGEVESVSYNLNSSSETGLKVYCNNSIYGHTAKYDIDIDLYSKIKIGEFLPYRITQTQ